MRYGLVCLVVACALGGCRKEKQALPESEWDHAEVIARVDKVAITVADFEESLKHQAPEARARYSTPTGRKEYLATLVRFEVMAQEAQRQGYDRDPDVQRVMKQRMIERLVGTEVDSKIRPETIPESQVEAEYKARKDELAPRQEVRALQIVAQDRIKADRLARQARATDEAGFRALVTTGSEDAHTRATSGDLGFFARDTVLYPRPVVDAAFAAPGAGAIVGPVASDGGWHVLRVLEKRESGARPVAEVRAEIRRKLYLKARARRMEELVTDLKTQTPVDLFPEILEKARLELPPVTATTTN